MLKSQRIPTDSSSQKDMGKQRSYNEIIECLDASWNTNSQDASLSCIKALDKELGSISKQLTTVFVGGTNGKGTTAHFTAALLHEEGLTVGILQHPHILAYNERLLVNNEPISNKIFTEIGNTVLNTAKLLSLTPSTRDILVMMALLYFKQNNVHLALLEIGAEGLFHPANVCPAKIVAITRVVEEIDTLNNKVDIAKIRESLSIVKPGMLVVSADQGKLNLQSMQNVVEEMGATWVMPIRKLAPLQYPFEQLHGRCAALAERIARIYANDLAPEGTIGDISSLLTQKRGQRGRPTSEAKKQLEQHPRRTVDQFWKETLCALPGRFQMLEKEKPTILLDNASNLDALENLLLGIRLLNYKRPFKGLALIIGADHADLDKPDFFKLLRYFFKKTSGRAIIYPATPSPFAQNASKWNPEKIATEIKNMKIKAQPTASFAEAFEAAQKVVDERNGLIAVTGSTQAIADYWNYKGMKKV